MVAFPIDRYLLPERENGALPDGFTEVRDSLVAGLPHRIELTAAVHAALILPTGLANQWLAADPLDLVSTSDDETANRPSAALAAPGLAERAPLRLVVLRQDEALGSVPLVVGLRRTCGPVEVAVLGWRLCAGTVRGAGDFGSFVALGVRAVDLAVDVFGPPPVHRFVLRRRPLTAKIESEIHLRPEFIALADKKQRRRVAR
ncbi:MAG: hypothetical protein WBA97_13715 [Actinophytocola sp.]|uniref:hypothetical protein n=1 Tax=Actinophytocola sp. TaxID=1872138 RepID=UPI003C75CB00